ncbi:MAG: elongation factor G [Candidatus Omnitrophica bacterium]|nr:elongation factor G [Candidatus Omnitrophota bacterium]
MDVKNKRTIVLLGHAQSGKTSLAESILFHCGAIARKGSTLEGNTVSDYNWDEIERKSSIGDSFMSCNWHTIRMQLIDTPGYLDFYGEVIAGIQAVDNAIVVVDSASGVEVGTERAWSLLEEANIPRIIFVNKTDKEGVDTEKIIDELRTVLSKKAIPLGLDNGDALTEVIAESDDVLLEKYLSTGNLSAEDIGSGMHKAIAAAKLFPIIFGSALQDKGIDELLDVVQQYFASPLERPPVKMQEGCVEFSDSSPFSALVFKSIVDPYVGQLSMARIFSGTLTANTQFYNISRSDSERIGHLFFLQGKEQRSLDAASCGDIIAIPKLKITHTGDTLCDHAHPVVFQQPEFPEAMISASVRPHSRQDEEKISQALHKLTAEDPTFRVKVDPETKEMVVSGLGDLHLHVMIARLKKRFNVEVDLGTPKVPYRESITKTVKAQGKFKRQSGGRGQYGDVWIEISPLSEEKHFEFVDKVFGGAIPKNFIPSVEKGIKNTMAEGIVAGYPMVNLQVTLYDGSYHDVDSSDMAFQIAARLALRKAVMEAGPVLLEPIMNVEIAIPEEFLGAISGDLNSRRGRTVGMEARGKLQIVKAVVPMSEMFTYGNDLRSMTQGRGSYTMKVSHYEHVPSKIATTIISHYQTHHKEEEI